MNAVPECLNAAMANYDGAVFRAAIASDKKNTTPEMRLVLPQGDGALELISIERSAASIDDAEHAMVRALNGSAA